MYEEVPAIVREECVLLDGISEVPVDVHLRFVYNVEPSDGTFCLVVFGRITDSVLCRSVIRARTGA